MNELSIQDLEYIIRILANEQYSFTVAISKTYKDKTSVINYYKSMRKEVEDVKQKVVDYLIERYSGKYHKGWRQTFFHPASPESDRFYLLSAL